MASRASIPLPASPVIFTEGFARRNERTRAREGFVIDD
jgi:hypothetical protein